MSIFSRASTVLRSIVNNLLSRAESPEKMLDQVLLDMRDQLARAKREVAAAIADERKLRGQVEDEAQQARDWEERAMLAVREERDDLAKQALLRQKEHADRAASLRQTWEAQAQATERLKVSLQELSDRIEEARRKRNMLLAKEKRVQAQKRIQETIAELSDTSAFGAFDQMADRIADEERRTLAATEVTEALSGEPLELEFAQLESGDEAEERLLALKREMGLLPRLPPGEEEAPQEPVSQEGEIREAELLEEFDRLGEPDRA